MAIQTYIEKRMSNLESPVADVSRFHALVPGTLTRFDIFVAAFSFLNGVGNYIFQVYLNGDALFATEDRPFVNHENQTFESELLDVDVVKGDVLSVDLIQVPGGKGKALAPIEFGFTIDDGIGAAALDDLTDVDLTSTPPTTGDVLVYDGSLWVPGEAAASVAPVGVLAAPRTSQAENDEFEATSLDAKWTRTGTAGASESFDDRLRSAILCEFAGSQDMILTQAYAPAGDFSVTVCGLVQLKGNVNRFVLQVEDATAANMLQIALKQSGVPLISYTKTVAGVNTFDIGLHTPYYQSVAAQAGGGIPAGPIIQLLLHLQRVSGTWGIYYSYDGVVWKSLAHAHAQTISVTKVKIQIGNGGDASNRIWGAFHWFRRDWIYLTGSM